MVPMVKNYHDVADRLFNEVHLMHFKHKSEYHLKGLRSELIFYRIIVKLHGLIFRFACFLRSTKDKLLGLVQRLQRQGVFSLVRNSFVLIRPRSHRGQPPSRPSRCGPTSSLVVQKSTRLARLPKLTDPTTRSRHSIGRPAEAGSRPHRPTAPTAANPRQYFQDFPQIAISSAVLSSTDLRWFGKVW
ncbi:hypothetical protein EVAR_34600_1 [Eumeta japonica]|uniref:Uncharacterized protein n=1 Tax=Eumeta variegata TaxID=151549 RepID=A0A4C1VIM2_EUMVA|nr:hypothetical protein EVAR_34600_1 [Eumeta japonica]